MCVCVCVCVFIQPLHNEQIVTQDQFLTADIYSSTTGLVGRVFTHGLGHRGSSPGRVKLKTQKMLLDTSLLNTKLYKVRIKGKVKQSRERSSAPLHLGVAFGSPSTIVDCIYK